MPPSTPFSNVNQALPFPCSLDPLSMPSWICLYVPKGTDGWDDTQIVEARPPDRPAQIHSYAQERTMHHLEATSAVVRSSA